MDETISAVGLKRRAIFSKSFEQVRAEAAERGFDVESPPCDYKNNKSKIWVRCHSGHLTQKSHTHILSGRGCAECSALKRLRGETICRLIVERIYGQPFPKSYPKWLHSAEDTQLELDMFNANPAFPIRVDGVVVHRPLAIEFQGHHHYSEKAFGKGATGFARRTELDERKKVLCRERGITLAAVPYFESSNLTNNSVIAHVVKVLSELGLVLPEWSRDDFDPVRVTQVIDMTVGMRQVAERTNCSVDLVWRGVDHLYDWTCNDCGKTAKASYYSRSRAKYGCKTCSTRKTVTARAVTTLARYADNYLNNLAQNLDALHIDLDPGAVWSNAKASYDATCRICGHQWPVTAEQRSWEGGCPRCPRLFAEATLDNLLHDCGFEPAVGYEDENTNIDTKCRAHGHRRIIMPQNARRRGMRCTECHDLEKKDAFYAAVAARGATVVGPYVNLTTKCPVLLANGTPWSSMPSEVVKGRWNRREGNAHAWAVRKGEVERVSGESFSPRVQARCRNLDKDAMSNWRSGRADRCAKTEKDRDDAPG